MSDHADEDELVEQSQPASDAAERPGPNDLVAVTTYAADKTTFVTVVTGDRVIRESLAPKKAKAALELMLSGTRPEDAFAEAASKGMLGGKANPTVVPFTALREITWRSDASSGKAKYDVDGKTKSLEIDSDDQAAFQQAVAALVALNPKEGQVEQRNSSAIEISLAPLGIMAVTAAIGGFMYWCAGLSPEELAEADSGGSRRRRKGMFFAKIAQAVGPTWIAIITVVALAFFAFGWISTLRNPPTRTTITYT